MKITEVLDIIGKRVEQDIKAALIQHKKLASGNLYKSVEAKTVGETLTITMVDYWRWVDEGRRAYGKNHDPSVRPPYKAILEWIKQRRIKGRDEKGKFITNKALAFAIRFAIAKNGIKPTNFFAQVEADYMLDDIDAAIEQYLDSKGL